MGKKRNVSRKAEPGLGKFGGTHGDQEAGIDFVLGVTTDGRVLIDFRTRMCDHIMLTPDMALELAEYLVETAKLANQRGGGILRVTP